MRGWQDFANDERLGNGTSGTLRARERKRLLIFSARIFDSGVDRGIRSRAAGPEGPNTRPPVAGTAFSTVTFFESSERADQAKAPFDLGRRAAVKP
jgi:hypothetical protein